MILQKGKGKGLIDGELAEESLEPITDNGDQICAVCRNISRVFAITPVNEVVIHPWIGMARVMITHYNNDD